jgi:hypothetical protein
MFRKDLTFVVTKKKASINLLPLLGADSLLTSRR